MHQPIKHITLIRPSIVTSISTYSSPVIPPISIAYLAASLKKSQFEVEVIDSVGMALDQVEIDKKMNCRIRGLKNDQIVERIPNNTDLIGISCSFSVDWINNKKLIRQIKNKFPLIKIVIGGEHVSALPKYIMENTPQVDICVCGEGEETIVDIAKNFFSNPQKVDGIFFRDAQNIIIKTSTRKRIFKIEDIPRPDWNSVPIENYFKHNSHWTPRQIDQKKSMVILASRGCPYKCTFCSNEQMWSSYHTRSPDDVIQEIEHYVEKYKINNIDFCDLTAFLNKKWILRFTDLWKEKKLNVSWTTPIGTRSEMLDNEIIAKLKDANCRYYSFAPDSGSPRILEMIDKKVDLNKIYQTIKTAAKLGLVIKCHFIIGFPFERRSDIGKTIWFMLKTAWAGAEDTLIFIFTPYPGSKIFNDLRNKNIINKIDDEYFTYLKHPLRIFRTILALTTKRKAVSLFEQRLFDLKNLNNSIKKCK